MDLLIMDVDNTILDTNSKFRQAQKQMLRSLNEDEDKIEELRDIDMSVADAESEGNEYDFKLLSTSLYHYYKNGKSKEEAVDMRHEVPDSDLVEKATQDFYQELESPHDLREGFDSLREELEELNKVIAFTEGDEDRIREELEYHDVLGLLDGVEVGDKTKESFTEVKEKYDGSDVLVVGDSPESDIQPANRAGFETVYIPSGFTDEEVNFEPDHQIDRIDDLKDLL